MITSLYMENWRSHKSTLLQFSKGTNLLIGAMGSGKSSALDAMCFALFGKFPALEHKTISTDEIITHGESRTLVRAVLEWSGSSYEITRELRKESKRASAEARIRKDGKLAEQGQSAVTKYLEHVMQTDYELFSRAIYSEQNGIDRFLTLEAGKRKQEMDELLGLDKFEKARGNAVKLMNSKKLLAAKLAEQFNQKKLDDAKRREQEAGLKVLELGSSIASISVSLEQNRGAVKAAKEAFLALKEKKERHEKLNSIVSEARGAVSELGRESAVLKFDKEALKTSREKHAALGHSLEELKKSVSALQSSHSSLSKELGSLEARMELGRSAGTQLGSIDKELGLLLDGKEFHELEEMCKAAERGFLEASSNFQSVSSEMRRLEEGMKKLEPGMSRCPVCRNTLTSEGMEHVFREYREEMTKKNAELHRLSSEKESKSKVKSELDSKVRKAQALMERRRMLEKQISECSGLAEKAESTRAELASLGIQLEKRKKAMDSASEEFQKARDECRRMEDAQAKLEKLHSMESALE
ncbi:MAG: SMC family ATPase, partial [Candidatus ainarchaeum sp.]|nr:SMC family ATPase [Candidatus ainarchaeum sp.]